MKKTKSKPKNVPQEKAGGYCTRTPETEALREKLLPKTWQESYIIMRSHAIRLEKERNDARHNLREIIVAVSLSSFLPGDAHEWLKSHPENA